MGETTLPCSDDTRERLEDLRGEDFRSWDAFLNYMADLLDEHDEQFKEDCTDVVELVEDFHRDIMVKLDTVDQRVAGDLEGDDADAYREVMNALDSHDDTLHELVGQLEAGGDGQSVDLDEQSVQRIAEALERRLRS